MIKIKFSSKLQRTVNIDITNEDVLSYSFKPLKKLKELNLEAFRNKN